MLLHAFTQTRPHIPFIGASGMAGFASAESIGIKTLGPKIYIAGDLKTGAKAGCGLMAPRVGRI
jgi:sulfur carrier protein ThiS adenylyltransferase